ncbi:MAG: 1-deoxy-D-xylulose-5-phosphate reductoisomerase [Actinomycetota bacterium]
MAPVRVAIAGSTGSIGIQTLDVISAENRRAPGSYEVVALAVGRSVDTLVEQVREHRPSVVVVTDDDARTTAAERLSAAGFDQAIESSLTVVVDPADVVVNAVVGFAGLDVTVETLRAGKRLALANKESLIAAGPVVQPLRATAGAELVPIDSEHSALHQCLRSSASADREVARLLLTASGGPFRGRSAAALADITVDQALAHPTWSMGPKITIDSSTLMNKGLEVIEAHELFGVDYDHIDVVVHPQSIVHSMVEYVDGSTIAQLSEPDMRLPIGYALGFPARIASPFGALDWRQLGRLDFEPPDRETFRCLDLAFDAGRAGGTTPAVLSAANEVAVDAFLSGNLRWNQIPDVCVGVMERHDGGVPTSIDDVIAADGDARRLAATLVTTR